MPKTAYSGRLVGTFGHQLINTLRIEKKGLVLQRGLEGIPEPEGFERTRGDNW